MTCSVCLFAVIKDVASFVQNLFPSFSPQTYASNKKPRLSLNPFELQTGESSSVAVPSLPSPIEYGTFYQYLPFVNRDAQCKQLIRELQKQYTRCFGARGHSYDYFKKTFPMIYSAGAPGIGKFKSLIIFILYDDELIFTDWTL
jgi:hypothetical protein